MIFERIGRYQLLEPLGRGANGEAVDARTDIYALGLLLFEAIGGYNPQLGQTISSKKRSACWPKKGLSCQSTVAGELVALC